MVKGIAGLSSTKPNNAGTCFELAQSSVGAVHAKRAPTNGQGRTLNFQGSVRGQCVAPPHIHPTSKRHAQRGASCGVTAAIIVGCAIIMKSPSPARRHHQHRLVPSLEVRSRCFVATCLASTAPCTGRSLPHGRGVFRPGRFGTVRMRCVIQRGALHATEQHSQSATAFGLRSYSGHDHT